MKVFGSSGVRGVSNEELTPEDVLSIAAAAGTVWDVDRTAIACDTRRTGELFVDAAASGLASVGCDVDRLGVVPTPAVQAYAASEEVPALVVTASHNPPEYNGVKLVGADGIELSRDTLERVEQRLLADEFDRARWSGIGRTRRIEGARRRYVEEVLEAADRAAIEDAKLTVALDPGHGAGALTSPRILRELGCEVVTTNAQPDGHFPGRNPEPVAENLGDLGRLVRAADADVGVAHDGDADRAIFYDETGEYVEGDAALAALAAAALNPGDTVVSAVNVSQRLVDAATRAEAALELTPIGSTNIITRIRQLQAEDTTVPVAGEGNGGVLFPEYRLARDGAHTAVRFLELLVDQPVSEAVAPFDSYENVRHNVSYDTDAEREAMLAAVQEYADDASADAELTTIDGYRLDYGDAWVLARPSGTEPLVRVYAEAQSRQRAANLAHEMREAIVTARAKA